MSKLRIVSKVDKQKWRYFLDNNQRANIFQTPQIYEVYQNSRLWEPVFLAAVDQREDIVGILLIVVQREVKGFFGNFTARAVVWGGPLVCDATRVDIVDHLLKASEEILKKEVIYLQFRNLTDLSLWRECFETNRYAYNEHLNFLLNLEKGEDYLWRNLDSAKRRAIRKAAKEKLRVKIISGDQEFETSYKILRTFYKQIGIPLADISLFESLYRILSPENMLRIFLVYSNNIPIATLYLLVYKNRLYVWYTASLSRYLSRRPNDILYWEAIKWGCQNGYSLFDFGGAGSPYKAYGVREFKKEFGGQLVNYGRFKKVYRPFVAGTLKIAMKAQRQL